MATTRLSTKGQVILPKAIRTALKLRPGAEFQVEQTADGVLLRPVPHGAGGRVRALIGCTGYRGPKHSIAAMDAGLRAALKRRG